MRIYWACFSLCSRICLHVQNCCMRQKKKTDEKTHTLCHQVFVLLFQEEHAGDRSFNSRVLVDGIWYTTPFWWETKHYCVCVRVWGGGGGTVPKQWKTCILTIGVITVIQRNWVSFNFFKPPTNVNMKFLLWLIWPIKLHSIRKKQCSCEIPLTVMSVFWKTIAIWKGVIWDQKIYLHYAIFCAVRV